MRAWEGPGVADGGALDGVVGGERGVRVAGTGDGGGGDESAGDGAVELRPLLGRGPAGVLREAVAG